MPIAEKVREFVEAKFRPRRNGRAFDDDTPLFSSGIVDSFGVLELIAFLEETFGVEIDTNAHEVRDFDTVRKIAGLVQSVSDSSGEG